MNPSVAQATDDVELTTALNWDVILGQNKTGAVLLTVEAIDPVESSGRRVGAQAFVQLTDLGAVWKRDKENVFWHGFSLTSGKSLAGIKLRLLDNDRKQLAQAVTDAHGNAQLPSSGSDNARWVAATLGRDSHVVAINNGDASVPTFRLGLPETAWNQSEESRATVYLFTDRGVYKPGDTLHLKGFARQEGRQAITAAGGKRLFVTAQDAREREFFRKEISLNEFGSFTADLNLPESGRGRFEISVKSVVDGESLRGTCSFQVQDYRPNSFEIAIPLPAKTVGESPIQLPVAAKYFMVSH